MSSPDKLKEDGAILVMDLVRLIRNGKNNAAIDHATDALRQARAEAIEECANVAMQQYGLGVIGLRDAATVIASDIRALTSAHKGGE